ncbi:hypothetical protein EI555_005849, partial [Monodon monoceros]
EKFSVPDPKPKKPKGFCKSENCRKNSSHSDPSPSYRDVGEGAVPGGENSARILRNFKKNFFCFSLLETMSHYTDEPRFTIEQIDLLQRLRRTGMTKHEILHALETLDRLDQEHSDKFGRRSSYGGSSYGNTTNNVPASSSTATASTQTQHSGMSPSPSNSYDTSPQPCTTNQNGRENNERLSTSNGKMSPTRYHANSMGQRSYSFEASEEDLDVDDKVEELMRRDSSVIKEEIKAFLANRRISQAVVAQVTGKS